MSFKDVLKEDQRLVICVLSMRWTAMKRTSQSLIHALMLMAIRLVVMLCALTWRG